MVVGEHDSKCFSFFVFLHSFMIYSPTLFFCWLIHTLILLVGQGYTRVFKAKGVHATSVSWCVHHNRCSALSLGAELGAYFCSFVAFIYLWMCIIFSTCTWLIDVHSQSLEHSQKQRRRHVGNSCAGQEWEGRLRLEQESFRHCLSESLCKPMDYLWVHMFPYVFSQRGGGACFISRCFGTRLCLNTSSASFKVLPRRLPWEPGWCPRGSERGPLREPWHWWRGTRCGTRVSAGSGCSSKPGIGWRSPQRPAASRTSRTAWGPAWAGSRRF